MKDAKLTDPCTATRLPSELPANPMDWALARMAVLIPTTSPYMLIKGPPLLPGLMAESV